MRKPSDKLRIPGTIARDLGVMIVSGKLRPGMVLDGEIEASDQRKVSRSAYREAVRILIAKGLVFACGVQKSTVRGTSQILRETRISRSG